MDNPPPSLKVFIKSGFKTLPKDWAAFRDQSGDQRSETCLFCRVSLLDIPANPVYKRQDGLDKDTRTFACPACDHKIQLARKQVGTDDMFGTNVNTLSERRTLLYYGEVDVTVRDHYKHLKNGRYNFCYICKNPADERVDVPIDVPVDKVSVFTGGTILVCLACANKIEQEHGSGIGAVFMGMPTDKCSEITCQSIYRISAKENAHRELSRTKGKHMCPSCTYEMTLANTKDDRGVVIYNERDALCACDCCHTPIDLDLTLKSDFKRLTGKAYCEACMYFGSVPFYYFREENFAVPFFHIGDKYFTRVVDMDIFGGMRGSKPIVEDKTDADNIKLMELILKMRDIIHNLLNKRLFDDPSKT